MLLGIWKNVQELEESISLDELNAILKASQDQERRNQRFLAALKGIDLDNQGESSAKEKFDEVQRRVNARLSGRSEESLELAEFGLEVEENETRNENP